MRRRVLTLLGALLAAAIPAPPAAAQRPSAALADLDRQIIVRFRAGTPASERAQARRAAGVGFARAMRTGAQVVKAPRAGDVDRALVTLNRHPRVLWAERNRRVEAFALPNDPRAGELWAPGVIDALEAWDRQTGRAVVVVAVVDEGVAYDHPDLAGNLWVNPAEAGGAAGVDDDGNGLADDVRGADFIDFDTDPRDFGGHGTHVAGTIAAEGNNGIGIAGVAWDARLMPVRVLGAGGGSNETVADGFDYAADMGADVVNASLGGGGPLPQVLADAVAGHPETLFVVAAGNGGADGTGDDNDVTPQYPCNLPQANLVCVAATAPDDTLTSFSNYGDVAVDLAAPGASILSARAERTALFTDAFEDLSQWTGDWIRVGKTLSDSSGTGDYANNAEDVMATLAALDLGARAGCTLDLLLYADIQPPDEDGLTDALFVETSTDGGTTWNEVARYTGYVAGPGDSFAFDQIDLRADGESSVRIRFRFVSDGSVRSEGAFIDDVSVKCVGAYDPNASYRLLSGTSMATPQVAGAAALLLSERPGATVAQLRAALLDRVDPLAALLGKVQSGGRLNVDAALAAFEAFPEVETGAASEVTDTAATLTGRVNPNGRATTYRFEYGPTPAYGAQTAVADAGAGAEAVAVSAPLSGLTAGAQYHYRLVATTDGEDHFGLDRTFTTVAPVAQEPPPASPPPVPPASPAVPVAPPAPPVDPIRAMLRSAKVTCRRRGSRRTCRVRATGARRVAIVVKRGRRTVARARGRANRNLRLRGRLRAGRRYRLTITLTHASGRRATLRRTVRL